MQDESQKTVKLFGVVLKFVIMFLRILNLRISQNYLWFVFLQSKIFQLRLKQTQSNFLFQKKAICSQLKNIQTRTFLVKTNRRFKIRENMR